MQKISNGRNTYYLKQIPVLRKALIVMINLSTTKLFIKFKNAKRYILPDW